MAFKMKGFTPFTKNTDVDKIIDKENSEILKKSNNLLIKEQEELYKKGEISKTEFEAAKEEIKGYTDVDTAKDYLKNKQYAFQNEI